MIKYKKLDEKAWLDFGKNLLKGNKLEDQEKFLEACRDKQSFLSYLDENLSTENNTVDGETVNFNHLFTENAFCTPPENIQKIIWDQFKGLPHEIKMQCGFWGYIVINLIESDCIRPSYLAAATNGNNKKLPSDGDKGLAKLDIILNKTNKESDNKKEAGGADKDTTVSNGVRRVLRSMCNPEPRGRRIIFNDFPIGKSYWHWHWSEQMSQLDDLGLTAKEIREVLDSNDYGLLSGKMHSGKSYISQKNILGGLLLFLKEKKQKREKIESLGKVIDRLSYLSVWKGLELHPPKANKEEIWKIQASLE